MDLVEEKVVLLVVLLLLGFGGGFTPHLLRNKCLSPSHFRDTIIGFLNCASAGVFFATFFMHMLPESQEQMLEQFGEEFEYPFAELVISLGFFFVMFLEQAVMSWYSQTTKAEDKNTTIENNHVHNQKEDQSMLLHSEKGVNYNTLRQQLSDASTGSTVISNLSRSHTQEMHNTTVRKSKSCGQIETRIVNHETRHNSMSHAEEEAHVHYDISSHSSVRSLVLLLALSAHALFEGLAIGFQKNTSALRTLVIAVIIHKMTLAFSYGMSLVTNKASFHIVMMSMIIFSVMAPIGIGVGTCLSSLTDDNIQVDKVVAIMQAFASGTFVYVIFVEIIPHEFTEESRNRMSNTICLMAGFAFMAAIQALPHEGE